MRAYLLRRFLLIPVTLIGVTLLVFGLTRILPGGPMEKAMQAASQADEHGRGGRGPSGGGLSKEQELQLARNYGQARSFLAAYAEWWGVIQREDFHQDFSMEPSADRAKPTSEDLFLGIRNAAGKLGKQAGESHVSQCQRSETSTRPMALSPLIGSCDSPRPRKWISWKVARMERLPNQALRRLRALFPRPSMSSFTRKNMPVCCSGISVIRSISMILSGT